MRIMLWDGCFNLRFRFTYIEIFLRTEDFIAIFTVEPFRIIFSPVRIIKPVEINKVMKSLLAGAL